MPKVTHRGLNPCFFLVFFSRGENLEIGSYASPKRSMRHPRWLKRDAIDILSHGAYAKVIRWPVCNGGVENEQYGRN